MGEAEEKRKSYLLKIGIYKIEQDEEGYWGAYDQNTGEIYYGGATNVYGVDGANLLELLRLVLKEVKLIE